MLKRNLNLILVFLLVFALMGAASAVPRWGPPNGFYTKYLDADTITADVITSGVNITEDGAIGTDITLAADKFLKAATGTGYVDLSAATGIFKTTTGTNTFGGNVAIAGSKTFTTGTGAVTLNGPTTIADLAAITAGSGSAAYDLSASTGAFTTSTGTNTLSGNTVISGSKTFATGTGAVGINGDVTIAATKGITKTSGAGNFDFSAGTGTFKTTTGVNTIGGATVFAANKGVTVTSGTSAFDFSGGSGIFKTSTGAVTIGPGATGLTGATTIANLAAITAGSGSAAYDLSVSTGVFTTSTGTNTLSGNVVISGSKTLTTGTGAVTVNGAATFNQGVYYKCNATTSISTTLTATDAATVYPVDASAGHVTLTLPDPTTVDGRMYVISTLVDMGSNNVIVATTGAGKIGGVGGADTLTTTDITAALTVISDGTHYVTIGRIGTWT